jgi:two-component system, LytTR family, sensor kinase
MNTVIYRILKIITSRVARNIYFCALLVYVLVNNGPEDYKYPTAAYRQFMPITLMLLLAYTYTNNLFLLPRFVATRKYKQYVVYNTALTLTVSALMVALLKVVKARYPLMETYHISLITSPVGPDWNIMEFIPETLWYAIGFLLWEGGLTIAWYGNQYYKKEKEAEQYKQKQVEAELSSIRNQVNPHFLFNTLNNIYGLALRKTDEAPEAIMKLSSFMRYLLDEGSKERNSSAKEIEAMEAYIELELLRITDHSRLSFSINTDNDYMMPGLIWLPILENVFKHGTRIISPELFIDYRFDITHGSLTIRSRNYFKNGTMEKDSISQRTGLTNLKKRLDILYPDKYQLNNSRQDGVYSIELKLPLG